MKRIISLFYCLITAILVLISCTLFCVAQETEKSNLELYNATTLGATPCLGRAKMLVFYTTFPGGDKLADDTLEEVEKLFFSEEYKCETEYGYAYDENDSVRSFYYRSSYGKLDMTGDVFEYTMKSHESSYKYYHQIANEIIDEFKDDINWSDYDANNDGYIDAFCVVAKTKCSAMNSSFVTSYSNEVNEMKIAKAMYTWGTNLSTILHETCHMFGPADMYAGVSLNPSGIETECIMDGGKGDLPGATKYVLGWTDTQFVFGEGNFEIELDSYSTTGSMAVIYPNGNSANDNWFVVEYLTKESNDVNEGVRIWKTRMNLDELHNIKGSDQFCNAMPNSPYEYLEAIHPDGVTNYYFGVGESITPYTYPSTAYGSSFLSIGGQKFLDDLTYSGISISVIETDGEKAKLSIKINNTPDTTQTLTAKINSIGNEFINDSTKVYFAQIKTSGEAVVTGDVYITDGTETIPVIAERVNASKDINLYLTVENTKKIKPDVKYNINLKDNIKSYYCSDINIENFDGTITFLSFVTPLVATESYTNGVWNHGNEFKLYEHFFTSKNTTATIYYDLIYKYVALIENDITTNKYTRKILEENILDYYEETETLNFEKIWFIDNEYYAVLLSNYNQYYMILYDREGNFLDDYYSNERIDALNSNSLRIVRINRVYYEVNVSNNKLDLKTDTTHTNEIKKISAKTSSSINGCEYLLPGVYSAYTYNNGVMISNGSKDIIYEATYPDNIAYRVLHYNNIIYLAEINETNIIIHEYNKNLELIDEYTVLEGLPIKQIFLSNLRFYLVDNGFAFDFTSVADTNTVNYSSTYLLLFDKEFNFKHYYRYGNSSFTYIAIPTYMCGTDFLFAGSDKFFFVNDGHIHSYKENIIEEATCTKDGLKVFTCDCGDTYTEPIAKLEAHTYEATVTKPTCTAKGYTTYTCACGDSYVSDYVEVAEHNYSSTVTRPATHLAEGIRIYTCSSCGDTYTENIAKTKEHSYFVSNVIAPTCEKEGYTVYSCECGDSYDGDKVSAKGHDYKGDTCKNCGEIKVDNCSCNCHKGGISGFFFKIINFFQKLFGMNKTCACGAAH